MEEDKAILTQFMKQETKGTFTPFAIVTLK